ncbi:MAG: hypothetical protein HKO77_02565 [Gemmatimonadetes bacterium]|nr:hypothetical protein [Gemmatimonadota bacterium]
MTILGADAGFVPTRRSSERTVRIGTVKFRPARRSMTWLGEMSITSAMAI